MTTVNISMPKEMKDYMDKVVIQKKYGTISEYMRDLVRKDELASVEMWLATELKRGMEGPFYEMNDDTIWNLINDKSEVYA